MTSRGALAERRGWEKRWGDTDGAVRSGRGNSGVGLLFANCSQISATAVSYGVSSELVHRDKQEMARLFPLQKKKNRGKEGALGPWWRFVLCALSHFVPPLPPCSLFLPNSATNWSCS